MHLTIVTLTVTFKVNYPYTMNHALFPIILYGILPKKDIIDKKIPTVILFGIIFRFWLV